MIVRDAGRAGFDPESFLRRERDAVERILERLPLDGLPPRLRPVVGYALRAGGKRLRPVLCAAAWRAVAQAEPPPALLRAGAAIELIHAYSLVHDDLPFMDDDDVRRGRATTHRVHGTATATVAGAAMILLAFGLLRQACEELGLAAAEAAAALRILSDGAGERGMVGGQWLDLAAESRALSRPELERVHALKTGALIAASVLLGGTLARATPEASRALAEYGRAVGLAFQIADDLLDARGDTAETGKTSGRDAALAKSTYPALIGHEAAERLARAEIERALRALAGGGIDSSELEAIARYAVDRRG
ncbi:MAG TPA: farnesyl diphosphate synthase [Longimicrobiales bacterium]|nr:farnesyl diphosphate synthase [Longimicrobiales bacterium]